ncbi:hypothetical protein C3B61_17430 [Cryobacterium zongtaii]|uniref:Uncharacterized protein n=1 Tax=Cryobacterium zongtaii TaxID=1259217 RepID=A0A2S3ZAR0_9MICO|nr:hypothetical protein C3B61_17430 [Cryobacterium zongtaii]
MDVLFKVCMYTRARMPDAFPLVSPVAIRRSTRNGRQGRSYRERVPSLWLGERPRLTAQQAEISETSVSVGRRQCVGSA